MPTVLLWLAACSAPSDAPPLVPADDDSFALLELFTSEGCSSCPPADQQVNRLADAHDQVFAIAWHVTMWDGLGWPDPFADPRYDQRHRDYATAADRNRYTPMMVAQGQEDFVGSNRSRVDARAAEWLAEPGMQRLDVDATWAGDGVSVHVSVDVWPDTAELQVVVVESGLVVEVGRGENADRTLEHDNVVRAWTTVAAESGPPVQLVVPTEVDRERARVIAFLQERETLAVIAATSASP